MIRAATATDSAGRLDAVFLALSDSRRRAMIDLLSEGPATVSELAKTADMALPSAVKHLSVLQTGGLVESAKAGRVRTYQLPANAFGDVERWVERRKASLHRQFDRLEEYLAESGRKMKKSKATT